MRTPCPAVVLVVVLGAVAVAALAAATVTASVVGTLPHDLVTLASVVSGYLVGLSQGLVAHKVAPPPPPA